MAVTLSPSPVHASGPAAAEGKSAQSLYQEGKNQYEIGEYEKALELWKEAFTLIDDTPENMTVRHALVYNIAEAEVKVYEVSRDITHLRKGKTLLERYLSNHANLYGDGEAAVSDRADAQSKLDEINGMLQQAESEQAAGGGTMGPGPTAGPPQQQPFNPNPAPGMQPTREQIIYARRQRLVEIENNPELKKQDNTYKGLIIGGGVLTGVGGLTSFIVAPTVALTSAFDRGFTGVGTGIFLGGVALIGGGVAMIVVGAVKRKKLRRSHLESYVSPWGGRNGAGLSATMHF